MQRAIFVGICLIAGALLPDVAAAQAQGRTISGQVTRAVGGRPIVGVTVTVTGNPQYTQTDDSGRYTVLAPDGDVRLSFRAIGFNRRDVLVPATQTNMDVALNEDVFELRQSWSPVRRRPPSVVTRRPRRRLFRAKTSRG